MARLVVEKPRAKVPRIEFGQAKLERAELEAKKPRAERLFDFTEEDPEDKVSFGTKSHRLMFPLYVPDTRFGQTVMPRGLQHPDVGPGRYDNEEKTNLLHNLEVHKETPKGTVMGGRTAGRFRKDTSFTLFTPAPSKYIGQQAWSSTKAAKPFGSGESCETRFPGVTRKDKRTPGPGEYEADVERDRRPLQHHSFGGPKALKVGTERLLPGPTRDHAEPEKPFIRRGYSYKPDMEEKYKDGYLTAFYKTHNTDVDNQLSLLQGLEKQRLLHRKAYLSRYYPDRPPPGSRLPAVSKAAPTPQPQE